MAHHILVIEEDIVRRQFFQEALGDKEGLQFDVAPSVEEARRRLKEPPYALIIDGDGNQQQLLGFCKEIKMIPALRKVHILLLASLEPASTAPDYLRQLGVDAYMQWPVYSIRLQTYLLRLSSRHETGSGDNPPDVQLDAAQGHGKTKTATPMKPDPAIPGVDDGSPPARIGVEYEKLLGPRALSQKEYEIIGPDRMRAVMEYSRNINMVDYYQVLGLPKDAPVLEVKKRYYQLARTFHPDRLAGVRHIEFMRRLNLVFKRMTEAYQVLINDAKRKAYDFNLQRERSRQTLRMQKAVAAPSAAPVAGGEIKNSNAKKFFELGRKALAEGNLKGAKLNFSFALQQAPSSAEIKKALEEVNRKLSEGS